MKYNCFSADGRYLGTINASSPEEALVEFNNAFPGVTKNDDAVRAEERDEDAGKG